LVCGFSIGLIRFLTPSIHEQGVNVVLHGTIGIGFGMGKKILLLNLVIKHPNCGNRIGTKLIRYQQFFGQEDTNIVTHKSEPMNLS